MGAGYLYFRACVRKEGSKLMAEPLGFFSALRCRFGKKEIPEEVKGAQAL
jgi:hypothetical protein